MSYTPYNFKGDSQKEGQKQVKEALQDKIKFIVEKCEATDAALRRHFQEMDDILEAGKKFGAVPMAFPALRGVVLDSLIGDLVALKAVKMDGAATEQIKNFLKENGIDPALLKEQIRAKLL